MSKFSDRSFFKTLWEIVARTQFDHDEAEKRWAGYQRWELFPKNIPKKYVINSMKLSLSLLILLVSIVLIWIFLSESRYAYFALGGVIVFYFIWAVYYFSDHKL